MDPRSNSALVLGSGIPLRFFPMGEWVYPADWEALDALGVALASDLRETIWVPVGADAKAATPLQLRGLRGFLRFYGARLAAALRHERVRRSTMGYWAERAAQLRAFGAPDVLVEDALEHLARADAGMVAGVDIDAWTFDAAEAAAVVDTEWRLANGTPLHANIDVAPLVLLALHCCITLDAPPLEAAWLESLEWMEIPFYAGDLPEPRTDSVMVRPSIYTDSVSELAVVDIRAVAAAAPVAPGGALVRICMEG